MVNVIISPGLGRLSKPHYERSMRRAIPIDEASIYLTGSQSNDLMANHPKGECYFWGATRSRRAMWDRMQISDVVVFTGNKHTVSFGFITDKLKNRDLAKWLWKTDEGGKTWEFIYCFDRVTLFSVSYEELNKTIDYDMGFNYPGLLILDNDRRAAFFDSYGSKVFGEELLSIEAARVFQFGNLDVPVSTYQRAEQRTLRDFMFDGMVEARCGICDRMFPVELLIASHIKKRAVCTDSEKKDLANVAMPMCVLGCDALYEKGYATVVSGQVAVSSATGHPSVDRYLTEVAGSRCSYWSDLRAGYFEWHQTVKFRQK